MDLGIGRGLLASAMLQIEVVLQTGKAAGVVFDYYGPRDFKFALVNAETDQVIIGHCSPGRGWSVDAAVSRQIDAGVDYTLSVSVNGSTVSVSLNGQVVLGCAYNAVAVDGGFGLMVQAGAASFDSVAIGTNDPAFRSGSLVAAQAPAVTADLPALNAAELAPILQEAKSRWIASGLLDASSAAVLDQITVAIGDLAGLTLASTEGTLIIMDADAAGYGWFIDPSPSEDSEFTPAAGGVLVADPACAASSRMDLLSVVMHEMGHVLGFGHTTEALMAASLMPGVRGEIESAEAFAAALALSADPTVWSAFSLDASSDEPITWLGSAEIVI